ncbi:MAG: YeeE/YedE family protein [Spirochaetales bacterium]|nr:YeeE/YedE family protein [Spirochaetales bacterium]
MLLEYWPFYIGGPAIALVAVSTVLFGGKFISVTRGYVSACSILIKRPFFVREEMGGPFGFRTMFAAGIIIGGFIAALTTQGYRPSFDLGSFQSLWGQDLWVMAVVLVSGGFLWGYGSRLARGCTSGNSIAGLSRGSLASLMATVCFLVGGVIVTYLVEYLLGGGR